MKILEKQELLSEIKNLLLNSRKQLTRSVNATMVQTYWSIGRLIVEDEFKGKERAEYGKRQLETIAKSLTEEFGKGFDARNLRKMRQFYQSFSKWDSVSTELSWTHYRRLMRIENQEAREWYIEQSIENNWSARALERQVSKLYYERLLASREKLPVEEALMNNLQQFLLELGRGFAFVSRQQRLNVEEQDFYIDLIFYNFKLKCFLLIDLKLGKLTHQDVGQMDTYVRVYDAFHKGEDDNPTVGLILNSEKSEAVAKYSVLSDSKQLFSSKYLPFLPSEEELQRELLRERAILKEEL